MVNHTHTPDAAGYCTLCFALVPRVALSLSDLQRILEPYAGRLAAEFMTGSAQGGAELWSEIIAAHPTVEELRKIAFEFTVDQAYQKLCELYPAAGWMPVNNLKLWIGRFQEAMRRKR